MADLNTAYIAIGLLAIALGINALVLFSALRTMWNSTNIANDIHKQTTELLKYAELNLETTRDVL